MIIIIIIILSTLNIKNKCTDQESNPGFSRGRREFYNWSGTSALLKTDSLPYKRHCG